MLRLLIVVTWVISVVNAQDDIFNSREFQEYDSHIETGRRPSQLQEEFHRDGDPNPFRNRQFSNGGRLENSHSDGLSPFRNLPDETTKRNNLQSIEETNSGRNKNRGFFDYSETTTSPPGFGNLNGGSQATEDPFRRNFNAFQNNEVGNFDRPQGPSTFATPSIRHRPQVDEFGNPLVRRQITCMKVKNGCFMYLPINYYRRKFTRLTQPDLN